MVSSFATLHCGAEPGLPSVGQGPTERGSLLTLQTAQQLEGRLEHEGEVLQFSALRAAPLAGQVRIDSGALRYELRYDYEARQVVTDGHGGALKYEAQRTVFHALERLSAELEQGGRQAALHEHMLLAGLGMLGDSGGMTLTEQVYDLGPRSADGELVGKALDDDGVSCVESGQTYHVSFDFGDTTVIDAVLQAGADECNGQCGPYCTQLQPWRMWTLDCLEHDACCNVTSDDACWTPLGECGDEYEDATADFLRGFDPFSRHCGG